MSNNSAAHLRLGLQDVQVRHELRWHAHGLALNQQVEHAQRARGCPHVRSVAGASGCRGCGNTHCCGAQVGQLLAGRGTSTGSALRECCAQVGQLLAGWRKGAG